jgi:hypothetical protein
MMEGSMHLFIVAEVVQAYLLLDVVEMTAGKCIPISAPILELATD